jgi:hypothetical protein
MKRALVLAFALVFALTGSIVGAQARGSGGSGGNGGQDKLEVYTVQAAAGDVDTLLRQGLDVVAVRTAGDGVEIDVVLTNRERASLQAQGFKVNPKKNKDGKTQTQLAAEQAAAGYNVYRSWDEPGGIRDELKALARNNPQLVKLEVLGQTHQGRELIALKVTQGANEIADGARPAAFYVSNQHAREWISVEVNRRLLRYLIDQWRLNNKDIKRLLKDTELWFVISANPDGYQYTFDHDRLWRKNLRDNDGDGHITNADGVDPNRNYNEHWNYDEEGSSSLFSSQTYRGPGPNSEPETQALGGLITRIDPKFLVNFHSYGPYILYPQGWEVATPDADNPIYAALAGTDANPGIAGFDPGISSDELYITNGETTDFADINAGTVAFTPELEEGCAGCGFVFPDNETLIQAEFVKTLPFDLDIANSALHPEDPTSHLGNHTKGLYLDQVEVDQENAPLAMFDFKFDVSYGDPQEVRVLAKRSLGAVTLKYQVGSGPVQSKPTSEWTAGERYGVGNATYYHVMRAQVTGTSVGDTVRVWFEAGGQATDAFTYTAAVESTNRVLVMAAEDYTGASPVYPAGTTAPVHLSYYTDALNANGIGYDLYDVDARGRKAPDALGVLSHYKAAIWYTGNDVVTREKGWGPGNASRLAVEEVLEVRDYLNEGGRLLYTGKTAGQQFTGALGTQLYDPFENKMCSDPAVRARCRPLGGSGDGTNDFLEYWLGAYILNGNAGNNPAGGLYNVNGVSNPFTGTAWGFNGADSAQNQDRSSSFITTSGILPPATYPQFTSRVAAKYDRPGGPFDPHTGSYYMYSQIGDISYKRLTRTINLPAGGATMSFWTSYNTEEHWDHVFVEVHTVGQDNWTTLPDQLGHTSQDTGESCPAGWRELHPFLDHYQTLNADNTCSPSGTTGAWNAATGNSGGWQQWTVDLGAYAGQQVEVSIAYVSDWAVQGLGTFVDDITVSSEGTTASFETGMDGWAVTGPPAGSSPNPNNFVRTTAGGFPEAAVVATADTLYMGFGFEGITGAATRNDVMGRAMSYLLAP